MGLRPGYRQTEIGVLPDEWGVRPLETIGQLKTGPFGTLLKADEYMPARVFHLFRYVRLEKAYSASTNILHLSRPGRSSGMPEYVLNSGVSYLEERAA